MATVEWACLSFGPTVLMYAALVLSGAGKPILGPLAILAGSTRIELGYRCFSGLGYQLWWVPAFGGSSRSGGPILRPMVEIFRHRWWWREQGNTQAPDSMLGYSVV